MELLIVLGVCAFLPPLAPIVIAVWLAEDAYRRKRWLAKRKALRDALGRR